MFRFTFILRSKYDRRMDFYNLSYCNLRYRDRRTNYISFHSHVGIKERQTDKPFFIPHIRIHVKQADEENTFHSLLIFESKADRGTNYVSLHPSYWDPSKTDRRTNSIAFHPSKCDPRKTDGQTEFHFAPHIGIKVRHTDGQTTFCFTPYFGIQLRQAHGETVSFHPLFWDHKSDGHTDKLHFILPLALKSKKDGQTSFELHLSCWRFRKTDGQTTFHFTPILGLKQDRQTDKLYFTSHIEIKVRQTRNLISCKTDRRTNYVSFHPLCWDSSKTYKLRLIIPLILVSKTDRRTNYITFHPLYLC